MRILDLTVDDMDITKHRIRNMMDYLGLDTFTVPHYGLTLPEQAQGDNKRPEQLFKLYKDCSMMYKGFGGIPASLFPNVSLFEITPTREFLLRAYTLLAIDCKGKALRVAQGSLIGNLANLILVFHGMNFLYLSKEELSIGMYH